MPVTNPIVQPMLKDICSSRVPIAYTFLQTTHKGYLDTVTNIIYTHPQHVKCSMTDQIPVIWNGQQLVYSRNRMLLLALTPRKLYWAPYDDTDLHLSASPPTFHQLILYNITDFPDIAADDYFAQMRTQTDILHELGLSTTDDKHKKVNFASNIVSIGLLSFLYDGNTSLYSVWIFLVCITVTCTTIIQITTCCFKKICRPMYRT